MRAITDEPGSAAPPPHIGYQIDRSFGPPMLYVEGDRRDQPPLLTINIAHEHELLITDQQAHALHAALAEALGLQASALTAVAVEGPACAAEIVRALGSQVTVSYPRTKPCQWQRDISEQHSIEDQLPRLTATADDLSASAVGCSSFGASAQWLCAVRWVDGICWRAVGPTGGWLVFSSRARFDSWIDSAEGRSWNVWGRP